MDLLKTQDELIKAVNLFSDLTGVTPGQTRFGLSMSGRFSSYDASRAFDEIKKYMKLDDTLITSVMILREVYEKYVRDTSIALGTIVEHARTGDLLFRFNRHVQLDNLIYRSSLNDLYARATRRIKKVLKAYDRKGEDLLEDIERMKEMLLMAASAEEQLDLRQYHSGADSQEKPAIVEAIVEFKSMEEAVRYAGSVGRNFIMVGYVPDRTNELWSYFFFLIKRGENIYTASDAVTFLHPTQKAAFNSRRGGIRAFEGKKAKCYRFFPYEIIEKFVERETEGGYTASKQTKALTLANRESRIKATFEQIRDSSLVWMNLVADRFHTKLFKKEICTLPELTGFTSMEVPELPEMSTALVPGSGGALVQWDQMRIDLSAFKEDDAGYEATAGVYDNEDRIRGINRPLERRYMPQVQADVMLPREEHIRPAGLSTRDTDENEWKGDLVPYAAEHCMGTEEELYATRTQVARLNSKRAILSLAKKEWLKTANHCVEEVVKLLNSNQALIFDHLTVSRQTVCIKRQLADYFDHEIGGSFSHNESFTIYQYLQGHKNWWDCKDAGGERYGGFNSDLSKGCAAKVELVQYTQSDLWRSEFPCPWTKARSTRHYFTMVHCLEDLKLLGYDVSSLPDVLLELWHHTDGRYIGNSILSNMDPMDNDLFREHNPWTQFRLRVGLHCSARAQKKIEKGDIIKFPSKFQAVSNKHCNPRNPYELSSMHGRWD